MTRKQLTILLMLAGALAAQELRGPVSGLVYDEQAHAIRVMMGVPGAAYLGATLAGGLDDASVSPDGRYALLLRDGAVTLMRIAGGSAVELEPAAALAPVAWSGDSVAFGTHLWRSLEGQPERVKLASFEPTPIAVAVNGSAIVAAVKGGIYRLDADGSRMVAPVGSPTAIALTGTDLYAADHDRKEIVLVRRFATSPETMLIANEARGVDDPTAIGIAADGSTLLVADRGAQAVTALNRFTGDIVQQWKVDFAPTRIERISDTLYRLNGRASETDALEVLELRRDGGGAVYFVPAKDLSASTVEE